MEDLRAGGAPDRRAGAAAPPTGSRRRGRPIAAGSGGGSSGTQPGVADVAAGRALGRGAAPTRSPKWRRIACAPAVVALDVGPDLAVLAPARARRPPRPRRGRAPRRGGRSGRGHPPGHAGRAATGDGAITPARARWPSSARSRSPPPRERRAPARARRARSARRRRRGRDQPVGQRSRAGSASTSSRLMKCTCSALSRFSASSSARAGRAVAPGAAGLLVVGLERRRARWRARPCGRSACRRPCRTRWWRTITRTSSARKRRCTARAALAVEPRVVGHAPPRRARRVSCARELLRARARARVDDRRQRVRRAQRLGDQRALLVRRRAAPRRSEMLGRSKPVATRSGSRRPSRRTTSTRHPRRGRGGGGHDAPRAPSVPRRVGQAEVVGPEVVTPLRDAVRLVDHEQPDARGSRIARRRSPATAKRSGATYSSRSVPGRAPRSSAAALAPASCCALTSATCVAEPARAAAPRPGPASAPPAARPRP